MSAEPLDLTPREIEARAPRRRSRRWLAALALVGVLAGVVVVLWQGLNQATVFFYNVDEAVAQRREIGDRRFRVQGNVVDGSIRRTDGGVRFVLTYRGARLAVRHSGEPPELFGSTIPVVIEGSFAGTSLESDRIIVRHDNTYKEQNPDRLRDAERDATQRAAPRSSP